MAFTPVIIVHVVAATGALILGGIALTLKKGTATHRLLGRAWVGLMLLAALVSFGIRTSGHFSWIHLLSVLVLTAVPASVFAAIRGRIRTHRFGMSASYAGLAIAGLFSLLPARRLGHLLWTATGLI
jgi:uncharacterized membrane protein